jgi:hypothetical protein
MPGERDRSAGNDDGRADIAAHGVKRDSNLLRHEFPGNPDYLPTASRGGRPDATLNRAGPRQ